MSRPARSCISILDNRTTAAKGRQERYRNLGGDSGVAAYKIGPDLIRVRFSDRAIYLYTYASAGSRNIEHMKQLAQRGQVRVTSCVSWITDGPQACNVRCAGKVQLQRFGRNREHLLLVGLQHAKAAICIQLAAHEHGLAADGGHVRKDVHKPRCPGPRGNRSNSLPAKETGRIGEGCCCFQKGAGVGEFTASPAPHPPSPRRGR